MMSRRAHWGRALFIFVSLLSVGIIYRVKHVFKREEASSLQREFTKNDIAHALGDVGGFHLFPAEMFLLVDGKPTKVQIQYSFEPKLQETMENLFRSYSPDYGALVAIDAVTGKVLSMVSYSRNRDVPDNLALRATFPSASVFKVVTAAAAIAEKKFSANTVIPFNGRNHTLYRSNILNTHITRWTRHMTLKDAFAKSVNTVFGKIGAFTVGPDSLRTYANRFGFNRQIASDVPIQTGHAPIPYETWALAESASGYTRENTMSPLQGALIGAAVVNDGKMMEPYVVQSVSTPEGHLLYQAEPKLATQSVDSSTAKEIRGLMKETVIHGTSHRSFRGFFRGDFSFLNVGGKTGSLTGMDPPGKYDWFVGYAEGGPHKIAIAALTIHEKLWRVKSSYLARRAIESYFHQFNGSARDSKRD